VLEDRADDLAMLVHGALRDRLAIEAGEEALDLRGRDRAQLLTSELAHDPSRGA